MEKHVVYAEDIMQELMKHPDNAIYKWELKNIISKVAREKETTFSRCMQMCTPIAGCEEEG